jgi:hypothetical protein
VSGNAQEVVQLTRFVDKNHPLVTDGSVDMSSTINAALEYTCNPDTPRTLQLPAGTFLIKETLICKLGLNSSIIGTGDSTIIEGELDGAILRVSGAFKNTIRDLQIRGTASSESVEPYAAILFFVDSDGWPNNSPTVENVNINSPTNSGIYKTRFGIAWEHADGFDHNNDQAQIINTSVYGATDSCYYITGGNAVWETFIGGHVDCYVDWRVVGGSFKAFEVSGGAKRLIMEFDNDDQPGDFPYQYGSSAADLDFESTPYILKADSEVKGQFDLNNLKCKCGTTDPTSKLIDWRANSGDSFIIRGGQISTPYGGVMSFMDKNANVIISGLEANFSKINYAGNLTLISNQWQAGNVNPLINSTQKDSAYNFCEINDRRDSIVVNNCQDFTSALKYITE